MASEVDSLTLCPGGELWVDVDAFEEAAVGARRRRHPAAYRAAINLYSGDLLPEDRYEEWAEGRREELRHTWRSLHVELARVYEKRGEYEKGIEALQRALSEEPTNEEVHANLMRLYAFSDRQGEALAEYELLREALSVGWTHRSARPPDGFVKRSPPAHSCRPIPPLRQQRSRLRQASTTCPHREPASSDASGRWWR